MNSLKKETAVTVLMVLQFQERGYFAKLVVLKQTTTDTF